MMTRFGRLMAAAGVVALLATGGAARAQGWNDQPDDHYAPPSGGYDQPYDEDQGAPPPSAPGYQSQPYGAPGYGDQMDRRHDADEDSRDDRRGYDSRRYDSRDGYGQGYGDQRGGYDRRGGSGYGDRPGSDDPREEAAADRCAAAVERDSRRYDRSAEVEDIGDVTPDSRGWRVQGVMLGNDGRTRRSFACTIGRAGGVPALSYGTPVRAR